MYDYIALNNPHIYLKTNDLTGRGVYAKTYLSAGTHVLHETPIYFYDQKKHFEMGIENCPFCKDFYLPEGHEFFKKNS